MLSDFHGAWLPNMFDMFMSLYAKPTHDLPVAFMHTQKSLSNTSASHQEKDLAPRGGLGRWTATKPPEASLIFAVLLSV